HRSWRRAAVQLSGVCPGDRVLDCATGTGDLAIAFKRAVGSGGEVVGTDFCAEMLESAAPKATRADVQIRFEVADALALPSSHRGGVPRRRSVPRVDGRRRCVRGA